MKKIIYSFMLLVSSSNLYAGLINGGFEDPNLTPGTASFHFLNSLTAWETTDSKFEIWSDGFLGVNSYEGTQHAELNAHIDGTLSQIATGVTADAQVGFQFAHRGRRGNDTMNLTITDLGIDNILGGSNDTVLFSKNYTTGKTDWSFYTDIDQAPIYTLGNDIQFAYSAINSVGGISLGNFIDAVNFGVGVGSTAKTVPEPTLLALLGLGLVGFFSRKRKWL